MFSHIFPTEAFSSFSAIWDFCAEQTLNSYKTSQVLGFRTVVVKFGFSNSEILESLREYDNLFSVIRRKRKMKLTKVKQEDQTIY